MSNTGFFIAGTPLVSSVLTANIDSIVYPEGVDPNTLSYTYRWSKKTSQDLVFVEIDGETAQTYTVLLEDVGALLQAEVTYSSLEVPETTLTSAAVTAFTTFYISGTPLPGSTLIAYIDPTGYPDGVDPDSLTYSYVWSRKLPEEPSFSELLGQTSQTYTVSGAEVGAQFQVEVTYSSDNPQAPVPETTLTSPITTILVPAKENTALVFSASSDSARRISDTGSLVVGSGIEPGTGTDLRVKGALNIDKGASVGEGLTVRDHLTFALSNDGTVNSEIRNAYHLLREEDAVPVTTPGFGQFYAKGGPEFYFLSQGKSYYMATSGSQAETENGGVVVLSLDPSLPTIREITIVTDVEFQVTDLGPGRTISVKITNNSTDTLLLSFPTTDLGDPQWRWLGGVAPSSIPADESQIFSIICYNSDAANPDIIGAWSYADNQALTGSGTVGQIAVFQHPQDITSTSLFWYEDNTGAVAEHRLGLGRNFGTEADTPASTLHINSQLGADRPVLTLQSDVGQTQVYITDSEPSNLYGSVGDLASYPGQDGAIYLRRSTGWQEVPTGIISVPRGGTGAQILAAGALLLGNGTGAIATDALKLYWDSTQDALVLGSGSGGTYGTFKIRRASQPPEGNLAGSPGDLASDTSTGNLYLKASGNGVAGWSQLGGSGSGSGNTLVSVAGVLFPGDGCYFSDNDIVSATIAAYDPTDVRRRKARFAGILKSVSADATQELQSGEIQTQGTSPAVNFQTGLSLVAGDPVYLSNTSLGKFTNDVSGFADNETIAEIGIIKSVNDPTGGDAAAEILVQAKAIVVR